MVREAARRRRARDDRYLCLVDRGLRPRPAAVLPAVGTARAVLPASHAGGHGVRHDAWNRSSRLKQLLKGDTDIATYTAYVGRGSPRFWLGLNPQLPDKSFAEIVVVSKNVEARERIKARLEQAVADGALSEARVRVDRFNFGPAGWLPGAVPGHRSRYEKGKGHRLPGARGDAYQ